MNLTSDRDHQDRQARLGRQGRQAFLDHQEARTNLSNQVWLDSKNRKDVVADQPVTKMRVWS
jgi:hypothetical protein